MLPTRAKGASSVFSSGITSKGSGHVYGAMYMLRVLRTYNEIKPTEFEGNIKPSAGSSNGCEPDAKIGTKILEFKSWSPSATDIEIGSMGKGEESIKIDAFGKFLNSNLDGDANSYTQFICYLNEITKMEDLNYYFDAKLLTDKGVNPEQYVKDKFKILFTDPKKQKQIFDIIWNNQYLRANVFIGINFNEDEAEKTCLKLFNDKISSIQDPFYNFIKTK